MTYAQIKDFEIYNDILTELIGLDDSGIDENKLDCLILVASEEIDNYLRNKYLTPLDPIPLCINRICVELVKYYLYSDYSDVIPEQIENNYKQAVNSLKDFSSGRATLSGLENAEPAEVSQISAVRYDSKFDDIGYFN